MKILAILALLASSIVQAAGPASVTVGPTVTLAWTVPLANVDGSTPANVLGWNVYRSTTLPVPTGSPAVPISKAIPLLAATLTYIDISPPGTYYAVTAWGCDVPPTGKCVESDPITTGAVVVIKPPAKPGSPASITVTVNGVTP